MATAAGLSRAGHLTAPRATRRRRPAPPPPAATRESTRHLRVRVLEHREPPALEDTASLAQPDLRVYAMSPNAVQVFRGPCGRGRSASGVRGAGTWARGRGGVS